MRKIEDRGCFEVDCPNAIVDVSSGRVLRVRIFADSGKCEKAEAKDCEIENCQYNKGKEFVSEYNRKLKE